MSTSEMPSLISSVSKKETEESPKLSLMEEGSSNFSGDTKFIVTLLKSDNTLHKECTALPYLRSPIRAILSPSIVLFFDLSSFSIV